MTDWGLIMVQIMQINFYGLIDEAITAYRG